MNPPLPITVVVPVRNGERYLPAALDSVRAQTCPPAEIIVVDDASTDASPRLAKDAGARLIRNVAPGGPARARNQAIQAAAHDHIAFLDADDIWEPEKLERQWAFAGAHPEFGLIATDMVGFDDAGRLMPPRRRGRIPQGWVLERLLRTNWIATSSALVPRAAVLACGGFDERPCRLGEDWMLWMHIAARYPVYFLDEVLIRRRVHADSLGHGDPEASFHDLLGHLDTLGREIPQLSARPRLVRRAAYRVCVWRASQDVQHFRTQPARAKLKRARAYSPLAVRAHLWTALSYVPGSWMQQWKRFKSGWRGAIPVGRPAAPGPR